jgi:hypothetical protein
MFKKIVFPIVVTLSFMLTAFGLTGCTCSVFSQDTWSGGGNCAKQQAAERAVGEEKSQRELPALKRRADSGDVKAQVAMGEFHIFEHHPNSDRATGLAYYDKAGRQGDLQAQRILLTESHNDCRAKARKLGRKELDGPQYAPHCVAEWLALETLATKACVRTSPSNVSSSIQVALGKSFEDAGRSDDADFWYVVAITHCLTAEERASGGQQGILVGPRVDGTPQQVRGAMWLGVRGRDRFPNIPLGTPEVEDKAKARLAMLRAKVASSGIRPAL